MSAVDVATVFAPRDDGKWRDYLPLLELQRRSAERFGHRHWVVTDVSGLRQVAAVALVTVELPPGLMQMLLAGQLAAVERWDGERPLVILDVDCLVLRDLGEVFKGGWEIGLTSRALPESPINNGAMYFAPGAKAAAVKLFTRALALCKDHWGGDQEAIAEAVAPVPRGHLVKQRLGVRVGFLSMGFYNWTPKKEGARSDGKNPYVAHFKGERKSWMKTYAEKFIFKE